MCDYSLHNVASRPAKAGDRLITRDFGTGTRGFAAVEDLGVAVCVLPGTELAFANPVETGPTGLLWRRTRIDDKTAIFRQINRERAAAHHDALEFTGGKLVLLTALSEGQEALVLQLPAQPKSEAEAPSERRAAYAG
jgi:hypothetical protein